MHFDQLLRHVLIFAGNACQSTWHETIFLHFLIGVRIDIIFCQSGIGDVWQLGYCFYNFCFTDFFLLQKFRVGGRNTTKNKIQFEPFF